MVGIPPKEMKILSPTVLNNEELNRHSPDSEGNFVRIEKTSLGLRTHSSCNFIT